jgi:superfamily II DNA helicase RecQ
MSVAPAENIITLQHLQQLTLPGLTSLLNIVTYIPQNQHPAREFLEELSSKNRVIVIKLCLLCWKVTKEMGETHIPKEFQLRAALATVTKKDSIVNVGTGYGKTLAMILPHLLLPDAVSLVLVPLKRIQWQHWTEFTKYGVLAVVINEDTSREKVFWKVRVLSLI